MCLYTFASSEPNVDKNRTGKSYKRNKEKIVRTLLELFSFSFIHLDREVKNELNSRYSLE